MIEPHAEPVMTMASEDEPTRRRIQAIARALAAAFDKAARDGEGHAGTHRAAMRVQRLAQKSLMREGPVLLPADILAGFESAAGLSRALRRHRVQGLALLPGASSHEFRALVAVLASEPRSGGLESSLRRLGVRRLWPMRSQPVPAYCLDLAATAASALEIFRSLPSLSKELTRVAEAGTRAMNALSHELRHRRLE